MADKTEILNELRKCREAADYLLIGADRFRNEVVGLKTKMDRLSEMLKETEE